MNKDLDCGPLDDSLTNIQWLGKMSTCALESDPGKQTTEKENQESQTFQVSCSFLSPQYDSVMHYTLHTYAHVKETGDLRHVPKTKLLNCSAFTASDGIAENCCAARFEMIR